MAALAESELPSVARGAALAWRLASDDALARAAARGIDGAFATIFHRYHAPLVRYCRSILLDADDAQDAAQNALTAALRALRGARTPPVHLRPWLYRIAHNEALAVMRRRPAVTPQGLDEEAAALAAPDDSLAREAFRELLGDLRGLPERQRGALVLRELEGLSYPEVALTLELSEDAARQAVFEARAALSAHRAGRAAACADVRRELSEGDGRTARARHLRAHLADCSGCTAFAEDMRRRRRALRALFPLPGIVAAGGGWTIAGLGGATVATKCAAVCATAVVLGGSVAAIETAHRPLHLADGRISATAGPTPRPKPAPRPPAAAPAHTTTVAQAPATRPAPARRSAPRRTTVVAAAPVRARVVHRPHRAPAVSHVPAPEPATTTVAAPPEAPATTTVAAVTPPPPPPAPTLRTRLSQVVQEATTRVMTDVQSRMTEMRDRFVASFQQRGTNSGNAPTP